MPWFSFHGGHSGDYCRHARGKLVDVLSNARDRGFSTYGLSEHGPRYRQEDLFPDEADLDPPRIGTAFAQFLDDAHALRLQFAAELEVLVGFESEVVPPGDWLVRMREIRRDPRVDFVIGSVHFVAGQCIDLSSEKTTQVAESLGGREALQLAYFDAVAAMVTAFRPEVVGHLDVIRKFDGPAPGFSPRVFTAIEGALVATREAGAALDVNASPARRGAGPVYPMPEILTLAQRMGVKVTLGDDSHGPDDVGRGLDACVRAIAEAGYREIHYLSRGGAGADPASPVSWRAAPVDEVRPG